MGHAGDVTRFTTVDRQGEPDFFVRFLDLGNALEDIRSLKRVMRAALDLRAGTRLLDVGCGTGDDVRDLAAAVGPHGRVVGLDVSSTMIAEANRRHGSSGLPIEFVEGNAQRLEFASASFDGARTERMFMHLADPAQALAEMVRVVGPGGRVVVFDFDWDTVFVDSPHETTTRTIVRAFSDSMKHGWIGRSLPRMFREAGLTAVTCVPHAVRIHCWFAHRLFDGFLAKAVESRLVSADELAGWWAHLERADAAGQFHFGFLGFVVAGTKAGSSGA
jgi:ubiquinone/menaquinone biosynthesis C-methylase UbiE